MPKNIDFIKDIIINSGEILKTGFGSTYRIDKKFGKNNLVTEFDYKSEKYIIEAISKEFPTHNIISEESGIDNKESEYSWIIDPLDGTVNFANNIPIFSVSIALQKGNSIIAGAVYNPISNELFTAELGKGAFFNENQIVVSEKSDFDSSLLVTGFPYNIGEEAEKVLKSFSKVVTRGIPVRRLGSAALDLSYVACGRFEGFWEANLNSWDVAAGILIVNEAGGVCTNYKNELSQLDDRQIVATNKLIHKDLLEIIE